MTYGLCTEYFLKHYCYLQLFYNYKILPMKVLITSPRFGKPMTERQLEDFLDKNLSQMHIGTLNNKKDPNIHQIWYRYEPIS